MSGDDDVAAAYQEWLRLRGLAPSTIAAYMPTIRGFLTSIAPRGVAEATRDDVERFLAMRRITPTSRGRYHYISQLAGFCRWAIDEGLATHDPTLRVPRPQLLHSLPRPVSQADFDHAWRVANPRMRCWLALGYYAGFRCKEMAGLRVEDIQWHREPPVIVVSKPKGRRQRALPMHPVIGEALHAFGPPASGYIFVRWDTRFPMSPTSISHAIARFFESAGVNATAHQLRHSFGTMVYGASKDLRLTQELLGHADPSSTVIYTRVSTIDSAHIVQGLGRPAARKVPPPG